VNGRLIFLLVLASLAARTSRGADFIDWKNLHNPVLSYPNWSIKDSAMAYRDGAFYVFFVVDHSAMRRF
jgi:hypothetical protein